MRVIKEGSLREETFECTRCGCLFAYNFNDLEQYIVQGENGGGYVYRYSVYCPTCEMSFPVPIGKADELERCNDDRTEN